jgi:hypothetical protein
VIVARLSATVNTLSADRSPWVVLSVSGGRREKDQGYLGGSFVEVVALVEVVEEARLSRLSSDQLPDQGA